MLNWFFEHPEINIAWLLFLGFVEQKLTSNISYWRYGFWVQTSNTVKTNILIELVKLSISKLENTAILINKVKPSTYIPYKQSALWDFCYIFILYMKIVNFMAFQHTYIIAF